MTCTNQGRDCPACLNASRAAIGLSPLHQDDGGHQVHGGVSFPIELIETEDEPVTTPAECELWALSVALGAVVIAIALFFTIAWFGAPFYFN